MCGSDWRSDIFGSDFEVRNPENDQTLPGFPSTELAIAYLEGYEAQPAKFDSNRNTWELVEPGTPDAVMVVCQQ